MNNFLLKIIPFVFLFITYLYSQSIPLPNGVQTHDGFFLRITPGSGYSQVSINVSNEEIVPDMYKGKDFITFTGFSVDNCIQIGGAVSDNLIIYGESGGIYTFNPSIKVWDEEVENPEDFLVGFGGVGPGVTYYFMPANVYLSLTLLADVAIFKSEGESHSSDVGFGFNFMAGKEWWAGEQWGLGISIYFRYGSQPDLGEPGDVDDLTISGYSFGALFSATFN
jgi:hypothetical protein